MARDLYGRLKAYEDTGIEPDAVETVKLALAAKHLVALETLNTTQSQRRKENHVCPLQIDVVDRLINRYSNPGDLVLDPFGGLGTVALEAIKAGRRGYTIELNNDYFRDAVGYLKEYDESLRSDNLCLFDVV